MNIAKEITKLERNKKLKNHLIKIFNIIRRLLCTHKNVEEEVILMNLGECPNSILEEIFKENIACQVYVKRVFCSDCGRLLYTEVLKEKKNEEDEKI